MAKLKKWEILWSQQSCPIPQATGRKYFATKKAAEKYFKRICKREVSGYCGAELGKKYGRANHPSSYGTDYILACSRGRFSKYRPEF